MKNLVEIKAELSADRQTQIEERANHLIAEEYVLRALKTSVRAFKLNQRKI